MSDPNFFLSRLNGEPHALAFGGQSTPWPVALADLTNDPALEATLRGHVAAANTMLAPVAADLLATTGRAVDLFGFKPNPARLGAAAAATVSVEGIALTQLGALIDAAGLGLDVANTAPVAVLGHSQGVLGAHMVNVIRKAGSIEAAGQQIDEILAIAELIGVAGTRKARELALTAQHAGATPMLSVRGATKRQVEVLASRVPNPRGPISIAVTNSSNNHVLSGYPEDLAAFEVEAGKEHKRQQTLRDEKVRGGAVFGPVLEYLEVTLPFHSPLMADAVEQAVAWAHACGFKETRTRELAAEVLLNHVDWAARVKAMLESCDPSKLWIVDFGPGNTLGKLIGNLIQGTGVGVVEAATMAERSALSTMEDEPVRTQNWKTFAPKVLHTPAGDKIRTKFTDLTGKPPVLLPGMTPTTVDPEIVAAAANAGYWAGLPYVGFKPGTVAQIRQVVAIAKAVAPTTILMQVEGGSAGGHHSWESLDDLLTSTYAEVRACSNLVLVAGGGIGTPERAADYISGQWARAYDLPDMPVDGVLIGTAVMTAKEAHTSPAVKQLLVKTPGITDTSADADPFAPAGEKWVPSGKSVGGVSSGLSHLHADIYEVENASAACGRLLVRVMKHPEELESCLLYTSPSPRD